MYSWMFRRCLLVWESMEDVFLDVLELMHDLTLLSMPFLCIRYCHGATHYLPTHPNPRNRDNPKLRVYSAKTSAKLKWPVGF